MRRLTFLWPHDRARVSEITIWTVALVDHRGFIFRFYALMIGLWLARRVAGVVENTPGGMFLCPHDRAVVSKSTPLGTPAELRR